MIPFASAWAENDKLFTWHFTSNFVFLSISTILIWIDSLVWIILRKRRDQWESKRSGIVKSVQVQEMWEFCCQQYQQHNTQEKYTYSTRYHTIFWIPQETFLNDKIFFKIISSYEYFLFVWDSFIHKINSFEEKR
jgi:hypothetical protein